MIELDYLKVKEYMNLEDSSEYDFAIKYANIFTNAADEYDVGDIMELPFGFIKDFQYELENGMSIAKLIALIQDIVKIKVAEEPLDKFIRFSNYLKESIRELIEVEEKTLSYEPSAKESAAGIDKFEGLGVYLQIRSLTNGDLTKYFKIRELPYSLCFTELYTSKTLYEYQQDLAKLETPSELTRG